MRGLRGAASAIIFLEDCAGDLSTEGDFGEGVETVRRTDRRPRVALFLGRRPPLAADLAIRVGNREVAELANLDVDSGDALVLDRDPGLALFHIRAHGLDRDAVMIERLDRR